MKRLLWLGLIFLSISWLFFVPIFTLPDYTMGFIFLIIGIVCNILAFWKHEFKTADKKYLLVLIPLLLSLFIIPFPYSLGPIILTIGILTYGAKTYILKQEKANWIVIGISLSGIILTIQTFLLPLYSIFVSHGHRVDALSPIISSVGSLFGLKASAMNGIVFVQTLEQTHAFTTTWEKLGFFPWFNILIGALILFFFIPGFKKIGKYIIGFIIFSGVYFVLRYVFVIFIYTQTEDVSLLWSPVFLFLTFLPFALVLIRFAPLKNMKLNLDCFNKFTINKSKVVAIALIFLFIFSLVGAFVFQDPGTEKGGKILIDELHSDWEDSSTELDKEWYGMLSTYNYYSWAEWLDKYYEVDRNINNTLTSDLLSDYDILVLKCPTNLYDEEEVEDIVEFVRNGGGLYLIGDHTNVFGMNYYLNQVSEYFGITFKTDSTHELGTGMTSLYQPDSLFPHTVVQNMEQFDFLTSCTLSAPITSENVIVGNRLLGEPGTYATENFFRESHSSLDIEYGLLLQVAAVKHGRGRVLAFTDSTCFSNFCVFMDGYKSFNLGTMEYLNRANNYAYLNTVFAGIALISLILSILLLRNEKKTNILILFVAMGLLSFSIATPVFSQINEDNYPVPTAKSDYTSVCFDNEHSDSVVAHRVAPGLYSSSNLYGTFFVWTQRVNCFPSLETTLEDALSKGDIVVIINPSSPFEEDEIDAVTDYVNDGGKVLLMDGVLNTESTANELLQSFGIWLSVETSDHILSNETNGNESQNTTSTNTTIGNITNPYLKIEGGDDVFITEQNETGIAVVEMGEGKLVVVVDSYTFSDVVMGGTFTEPDDSLRSIYNTEYYLFEELLLADT